MAQLIKNITKRLSFYSLLIIVALISNNVPQANGQSSINTANRPSWWFGAVGGANFNFYNGSTQTLNSDKTALAAFTKGGGIGLFLGPTIEYYRYQSLFGFMVQAGYDGRGGSFSGAKSVCNCPLDLATNLAYLTIEPSLRYAPFRSNFYLFGGPRFAFNLNKSFEYQQRANPAYPDQVDKPAIKGDFSNANDNLISMQIGAGLDIPISSQEKRTQWMFSPFVSFHPYFGQNPRSTETWNVTTVRAGAALKFGVAKRAVITQPVVVAPIIAKAPVYSFTVNSPKNVVKERTVRETFPIRNYVFFDIGSTEIPKRYVKLKKNQVADFKEEQVELFTPQNLSGRSSRQMIVYYNILNIVGDRMGKNPSASITLVGSSETSIADGKNMAEEVKKYLVEVFEINPSRIRTEGRTAPQIPSGSGGNEDRILLEECNRRVSIESTSPAMLMEFESGPTGTLKPLDISVIMEAPPESFLTFTNEGSNTAFTSWSMEIRDDKGKVSNYGPYNREIVAIPGKTIMGESTNGMYRVRMIGAGRDGKTYTKDTSIRMNQWTPSQNDVSTRFSVIYEFDESKAKPVYEKYLTEIVSERIPRNATVILQGYTDIIGDATYNQNLSRQRANDVRTILQKALAARGRSDVKFEVYAIGGDNDMTPFENKYPEERFYNRSVVIDIIPAQ